MNVSLWILSLIAKHLPDWEDASQQLQSWNHNGDPALSLQQEGHGRVNRTVTQSRYF